jgi:hypothetical protein
MGIANRAFPFFAAIDDVFAKSCSPTVSLVIWGILGGVVSMFLYRALSPQDRIAQCKTELASLRRKLSGFEGEFAQILPLLRNQLSLSLNHVSLTVWPACVASIPMLFLLAWLSVERSYTSPLPETSVVVETYPTIVEMTWSAKNESLGAGKWRLIWPPIDRVVAHAEGGDERIVIPNGLSMPSVHKHQWWNALIGNPAGYIPDSTSIDRLYFKLTPAQYLGFGPAWMRGWEFTFFSALLLTSIVMKLVFRIK